jgi:dCMP deaminase
MTWDEYALDIATTVSEKSKDPWRKVGACILRSDNSIAAVGYNGFPAGMREDWTDRDKRRSFVVHAEQNALRYTRPNEGVIIAVTTLPCNDCLKAIAAYGIKRVVYKESYEYDESTLTLADYFGIMLKKIT